MASAAARERGNALYKEGKLHEAEAAYKEAANLAPSDPAPISNLSAVKFELGKYADAATLATKAIELSQDLPAEKIEKLLSRRARSYLFSLKVSDAKEAAEKLDPSTKSNRDVVDAIRDTCQLWKLCGERSSSSLWMYLLDRIPRYKPRLQDEVEYFAVGHDEPEPLFDKPLLRTLSPNNELSYLFCGSGDARHLFATMISASMLGLDPMRGTAAWKSIHFTLVDIKAAVFSRTLVMFELLMEYAIIKCMDRSENAGNMSLLIMSYVYTGHILPPMVYDRLQSVIERAIRGLEDDKKTQFPWMYIQPSAKPHILRHLRNWQQPVTERFATSNMRKSGLESIRKSNATNVRMFGQATLGQTDDPGYAEDRKLFDMFLMIQPPKRYTAKFEPDLAKHISGCLGGDESAVEGLTKYLDENWKPNVTLLDMEWDARRISLQTDGKGTPLPELDNNPFRDASRLLGSIVGGQVISEDTPMIEALEPFWSLLANAVMKLDMMGKMTMEIVLGEMGDVMERLRHDAMPRTESHAGKGKGPDTSKFPRQFNRIHMSNVPDYVGGLLTPLLYGQPLLRNENSTMHFNVLLNPPHFNSHEHFAAEYLLMPDSEHISRHFGATRVEDPERPADRPFHMAEDYWIWKKDNASLRRGQLLTRSGLEKWLYSHFLKIILPFPRPPFDPAPVIAPLNLNTFLGLVVRAYEVGYPAHWLSTILECLCSGKVSTTARAPRMLVVDPDSAQKVHDFRELDVSPWATDFKTLLSVWRRLLPFGIATPKNALVPLSDIDEYSIRFERFLTETPLIFGAFMIVFWDCGVGEPPENLRDLLLDDETSSSGSGLGGRVHAVNTFKFVTASMTASFWLPKDVAQGFSKEGKWKAFIWRTDTWIKETDGVEVNKGMTRIRNWADD